METKSDPLAPWRGKQEFTITEAAHLCAGMPPGYSFKRVAERTPSESEQVAEIAGWTQRLRDAAGELGIEVKHVPEAWESRPNLFGEHSRRKVKDAHTKYGNVQRARLVEWLRGQGPLPAFFNAESAAPGAIEFPNCSIELRAAIDAVLALNADPASLSGKSPKAALEAWLAAHKAESLSKKARARIATLANWKPAGGAPKTPGRKT